MRQLSSSITFVYKWVFPIFWFGIVALFIAMTLFQGLIVGGRGLEVLLFLIVPLLMAAFGYFIFKKLIFDLVDEVWDTGDALLVRNRGREERIALSNIANVNYQYLVNPSRVTLQLREPSSFGRQITFCAPLRIVPFTSSPLIDELIARVDARRRA